MLISSLANPNVKQLRALSTHKGRSEYGLFLLEGAHLLEEALAAQARVTFCLLADDWPGKWALAGAAANRQIPCYFATTRVMSHVGTTESPLQAVAAAQMRQVDATGLRLPPDGLAAVLFGVQDPGNLGTTIRTAVAAGASAVVSAGPCADFFHPKVVRATAGALFHIILARAEDPAQFARDCVAQGYQACAALAQGGLPYRSLDYRRPTLFVLGSEAHGLPDDLLSACTHRVTVAMAAGVESLNVAVCAGILLFEARAQRTTPA